MEPMTQAQYARHRGCSRQMISKLVASGKIQVDENGRIDPAAADFALGETRERVIARDEPPPEAPAKGADPQAKGLTAARTADAVYAARIRQLDFEERIGKLVRTDDVVKSMERCAEVMVREIDQLPARVEDIIAAYENDGLAGARAAMKTAARDLRENLAANMRLLGNADADEDEPEKVSA